MARLFIDGDWYSEVSGSSFYETEYETLIMDQASILYPGYYALPFKLDIASEEDVRRPDLVLVDRKYRDWWVVEVELGHHSLYGHVIPQVRTFANGHYGREVVAYLCRLEPELDPQAMIDLTKGGQPRILVIVETPKPKWVAPLRLYRAALSIIEVYRSNRNRYVFRASGDMPRPPAAAVSRCTFDPLVPSLLHVHTPAALELQGQREIYLNYQGAITPWSRIDARDKVWLHPKVANPLARNIKYQIERLEDGTYEVTAIS